MFLPVVSHYWDMCRYEELEVVIVVFRVIKNKIITVFCSMMHHSKMPGANVIRVPTIMAQCSSTAKRSISTTVVTAALASTMASFCARHCSAHITSLASLSH